MSDPARPASSARPRPTTIVRLGPLKLTGLPAVAFLLVLLAGIVALAVSQRRQFGPMWISGALWIVFVVYWNAAARNTAPTASSESARSRRFHVLATDLGIVLGFAHVQPLRGRWLLEGWGFVVAGLLLETAGLLLAVWARRHLGRYWSARVETKVDHRLVRSGPYRRIRHPIYTAMLAMVSGNALVSGHWHGLVGLALVAAALGRKLVMEERRMREAFGAEWEDWRHHSWALVPGIV